MDENEPSSSEFSGFAFLSKSPPPTVPSPPAAVPATPPTTTPPTISSPLFNREIILQVGERQFTTTYETLSQSTFFESLLSGCWNNARDDGSYFIDADPDLFQHILRYLRRGVYSLFYDRAKGHDYDMYNALIAEAKYLGIKKLETWLEVKNYYHAVKLSCEADELSMGKCLTESSDAEVEYSVHYIPKLVDVCPRDIPAHRGDPDRCGIKCHKAQDDQPRRYEEEYRPRIMAVTRRVL